MNRRPQCRRFTCSQTGATIGNGAIGTASRTGSFLVFPDFARFQGLSKTLRAIPRSISAVVKWSNAS